MFTGIIQEIGKVVHAHKVGGAMHLSIHAPVSACELRANDSVSVNGVCQTVIEKTGTTFKVEAVEETLKKTTLGELIPSSMVNLELPMRLTDRVGGHLVQGHVDGIGVVSSIAEKASSWLITIRIPAEFARYVIPVGSIAIDGVSLTVASVKDLEITVSIIPHTMKKTTFPRLTPGERVNLEFDLIGKYLEKLLSSGTKGDGGTENSISMEKLKSWGYTAG